MASAASMASMRFKRFLRDEFDGLVEGVQAHVWQMVAATRLDLAGEGYRGRVANSTTGFLAGFPPHADSTAPFLMHSSLLKIECTRPINETRISIEASLGGEPTTAWKGLAGV